MKNVKKFLALLCAVVMCIGVLAGCGGSDDETENTSEAAETVTEASEEASEETSEEAASTLSGEVIVFAAASMTETLTEIGDLFMEENPDVTVTFNFDSSGTLYTQIVEGADVDVFISASQKQMNQLDIDADAEVNTDGNDYVIADTRFDILENKVVLAVADESTAAVTTYDDLMAALTGDDDILLAIGNSDVPVGQYTELIFEYYGIDMDSVSSKLTYGTNVKEVTTQVSEETADCGIIYATDAFSAGLTVVDEATAEMCGQVIYPAAVLNTTQNEEAARAFLEFCTTDAAAEIFESVGFTPLS